MADPSHSAAAVASSLPVPVPAATATAATAKYKGGGSIITTSSSPHFLKDVPAPLRIQVIHQDDDIIVVYKPCNLRSVPGNADNNNNINNDSSVSFLPPGKKRKYGEDDTPATGATTTTTTTTTKKMTPQEAWVEAIKILAEGTGGENNNNQQQQQQHAQESHGDIHKDKQLEDFLKRLGGRESQRASIPRRYAAFVRYIKRSRNRLFGEKDDSSAASSTAAVKDQDLPEITQQLFCRIEAKQREILQQFRPQPTTDQESVVGQCKLLGLAKHSDSRANQDLFVVHRLDCQTSGLLVLARTASAASFLSQCWRTRDKVQKTYRAWVEQWPPWEQNGQPEKRQTEGEINLPMSPHPTERLKWVVNHESDGKESLTKWKVLQSIKNINKGDGDGDAGGAGGVVLELKPITGRTHQLRVHCAAMGGVIRGDSLYGKAGKFLYLHAEKLAFPHPSTKEVISFQIDPKW